MISRDAERIRETMISRDVFGMISRDAKGIRETIRETMISKKLVVNK